MALKHWAFIYTAPGMPSDGKRDVVDSGSCKTVLVGVPDVAAAIPLAATLVDEGVQLIELCGGFGPAGSAMILEAVAGRVPIGSVAYGPESVTGVHKIFAD